MSPAWGICVFVAFCIPVRWVVTQCGNRVEMHPERPVLGREP